MKKTQFLVLALSMMVAMVAPALAAPNQELSPGSYDVVVYINGTEILAEDSNGQLISNGTAGIDDSSVIQAAVEAISNGTVVLQAGTYTLTTSTQVQVSNPENDTEDPSEPQKAYKVHAIPGRINFVDFDFGGEGVAYHDTQAGNQGGYSYRTDNADVDIGERDALDVAVIAHTYAGEWLQFSEVQVAESRTYAVTFYTSTTQNDMSFSVLVDGQKVATVDAPNTGDWYTFAPTTMQIPLTAGKHTVQIAMDTGWVDLAYVEFATEAPMPTPTVTPTATPTVTPTPTATPTPDPSETEKPYKAHSVPGRINFVDFDFGGEDVAYHDTVAGNQGGYSYRTDNADVDIGERPAVNVPVIAYTYPGEWLKFSEVQVAESRTYAATFYTSTTADDRSFSVLVDGQKVSTVDIPKTGDWHTFAPTTVQIPLTAGKHTVQIAMDTGSADLAYVEFATEAPTPTPTATPTATPTVTPTPTVTATPEPTQTPTPAPSDNVYGADANPTGNPIGGGSGYNSGVSRNDADFFVDTQSELLSALQSARSGDIIWVEENANIDMNGRFSVQIPAGVTIASNRGENGSPGGRIYQSSGSGTGPDWYTTMFKVTGQNVRITGLRLQGPDNSMSSPQRFGIFSTARNLEVDNCEIFGWGYAGIAIFGTAGSDMKTGGYIHHNYIHHCQTSGLGYGVEVGQGGVCLIEANKFDYCRHAIAGTGDVNNGYE
ncbi:carbohydrate-binding protein, partial [Methanoculleus sp.]|uniref:carbohydrate-binding protein n=1 Tax=Methanoculleus sp. TaxID=90427 RepID=UPI002FC9AD78